jgi:hypothetical protein
MESPDKYFITEDFRALFPTTPQSLTLAFRMERARHPGLSAKKNNRSWCMTGTRKFRPDPSLRRRWLCESCVWIAKLRMSSLGFAPSALKK